MLENVIKALIILSTCGGILVCHNGTLGDLWEAGNIGGKIFTVLLAIISFPGLVVYYAFNFLSFIFYLLKDFLFPRKSGYQMKIPYDQATFEALQAKKIYFERWGRNTPRDCIVFLCKKDWEKALKYFPELESKIKDATGAKNIGWKNFWAWMR